MMALSDSMLQDAVLGTRHERVQTSPRQMLQTTIERVYRQQAGHTIKTCADALPLPSAHEEGDLIGDAARYYLHVLLTNENKQRSLPEWVQYFTARRLRVDPVYLLQILDVGDEKPHLTPFLYYLLGNRGLWLVQHGDEAQIERWAWATQIDPTPIDTLIHRARWRDGVIIEGLIRGGQFLVPRAYDYLRDYDSQWTDDLSLAILDFVESFMRVQQPYSRQQDQWSLVQTMALRGSDYLPVKYMDRFIAALEPQIALSESMRFMLSDLTLCVEDMADFRRGMRDAFHTP